MKDRFKNVLPIITAGIAVIFEILKKYTPLASFGSASIILYTVIGLFILLFLANLVVLGIDLMASKRSKKLYDTSSILTRTAGVTKDLKKMIKKVDSEISKAARLSVTLEAERKDEVKSMKENADLVFNASKHKTLRVKEYDFASITSRDLRKEINNNKISIDKVVSLNTVILKSIDEMERALLVLEQYDTRIYLGDYVLRHSNQVLACAKAYIDLKGWTYSLLGKTNLFRSNVEAGIKLLEEYLNKGGLSKDEVKTIYLRLARAYRHLGSDIISAQKEPDMAIKYNEKAMEKLNMLVSINSNYQNDQDFIEMNVGVTYGIINANLYKLKKGTDVNTASEQYDSIYENMQKLKEIKEKAVGFTNPHRFIKIVLLENEYIKLLEKGTLYNASKDDERVKTILSLTNDCKQETLFDAFVKNTTIVENRFKQAIYVDEMMETYITHEVNELYKRIEDIVSA